MKLSFGMIGLELATNVSPLTDCCEASELRTVC